MSKVAATLRLAYAGLKRRLTVLTPPAPVPSTASPAFVEMMLGLPPLGPGCVLTLSGARGRSLRIELTGVASSEVTAVASSEVTAVACSLWEAVPCSL